jgi:hypothetical protein
LRHLSYGVLASTYQFLCMLGFGSPCGKRIRLALHVCREVNVRSSIRTLSKGATNLPCGQLGLPRISNQVRQRKVLDQVHPKPNVERTACKMLLQKPATLPRRDIR